MKSSLALRTVSCLILSLSCGESCLSYYQCVSLRDLPSCAHSIDHHQLCHQSDAESDGLISIKSRGGNLVTSQRFSLKEIIFICQDGAKNNTQIFVTLITHIWRMLAWGVGIHVSLGMHAQDEPLPCACPCFQLVCRLVRSATQELKGLFLVRQD